MNRKVLVTGGTGNSGPAVVKAFLDLGYDVIVTHRKDEGLQKLRQLAKTERLTAYHVELTEPNSVNHFVSRLKVNFGQLDAIVHLAGSFEMGELGGVFHRMMLANYVSGLSVSQFAPHVIVAGGTVVFVSSKHAELNVAATPANLQAYAGSKRALEGLTDALREELAAMQGKVVVLRAPTLDTLANKDLQCEKLALSEFAGQIVALCHFQD